MSTVEDYGQGYPRLAAFLSLDKRFTVLKRFDYLHMRNILHLQDQLVELDEELNRCDDGERIALNLGSRRQCSNEHRKALLDTLHSQLRKYG